MTSHIMCNVLFACIISLLYTRMTESYNAPRMEHHPQDALAVVGDPLTLSCRATGNPPPVYSWKKNGNDMSITGVRIKSTPEGDLKFDQFQNDDIGDYQCIIRVSIPNNELRLASRIAKVTTPVIPSSFKRDILPSTGYFGGAMLFSVDTSDFFPPPQIAWNYKGKSKISNNDPRFTVLPNGVLQIYGLTQQESGELRAIASPSMSSVKTSNLVYGTFQKIDILSAASRPSSKRFYFLSKPQDIDMKSGQSFILEAFVDSANPVTYTWYKDDQQIQLGNFKSIVGQGNLKILFPEASDAGDYKVVVTSGGQSLTASASVKTMSVPQFTKSPPALVNGYVTENVQFEYALTGYPAPKIIWSRDGDVFGASSSFAVFGSNFLRIENLISSDAGMYQGIATNALGMAEITFELLVIKRGVIDITTPTDVPIVTFAPRLPTAPQDVKLSAKSQSEIIVNWKKPLISDGLLFYTLSYRAPNIAERTKTLGKFSSSYTIENLEPGQTYTVQLSAMNGNGESPRSSPQSQATPNKAIPPGPVWDFKHEIFGNVLKLTWNKPTSGSMVTKYKLIFKNEHTDTVKTQTIYSPQSKTEFTVLPETSYSYSIQPISASIEGGQSIPVSVYIPKASMKPGLVKTLVVAKFGSDSLTLKWEMPEGTLQPDEFLVVVKNLANSSPAKTLRTKNTFITAKNLQPLSNYKIYVVSVAKNVKGDKSPAITQETLEEAPPAPLNLMSIWIGPESIKVRWSPVSDDNFRGSLSGYKLEYNLKSRPNDKTSIPNIKVSKTEHKISGLQPTTTYEIVVRAIGSDRTPKESGPSNIITVKTTDEKSGGPSAPQNFQFVNLPDVPSNLMLSWTQPLYHTGVLKYYLIYYRPEESPVWFSKRVSGTLLSYNITHFEPGTQYSAYIAAVDDNGRGDDTRETYTITLIESKLPLPPVGLKLTGFMDSILASWMPPHISSNVVIRGYTVVIKNTENDKPLYRGRLIGRSNTQFRIYNDIYPKTQYKVTVRSFNRFSESVPRSAVTITLQAPASSILITHLEEKATKVTFRWNDTIAAKSGDIEYSIRYITYKDNGESVENLENTITPEVQIIGLSPYTPYQFFIKRVNDANYPTIASVDAKTKAAPPSAPIELTSFKSDTATELLLGWQTPQRPNGVISKYTVLFSPYKDKDSAWESVATKGPVFTHNVTGLAENTRYFFRVFATNDAGDGTMSEIYEVDTPLVAGVLAGADGGGGDWWWILLLILLLLLLLILFCCCCYYCCWGLCLRCCFACCPCCEGCWYSCCFPFLLCCCPCCCKEEKKKKVHGSEAKHLISMSEEKPLEMTLLRATDHHRLSPPSVYSGISGSRRTSHSTEIEIKVPVPGEVTFISYKTSLQDYCQKVGWLTPVYATDQYDDGCHSKVVVGGLSFDSGDELGISRQDAEQRAAYFALIGLHCMEKEVGYSSDSSISVPAAGDASFISYKCSLHDFCQQCNILPPRFMTMNSDTGYSSSVQVGSHTFNMSNRAQTVREAEQRVACIALQGLCMMDSQSGYFPEACFTVSGPSDASFVSFKSSLHDFCQKYKLPPPQYITNQGSQGYSAKLKFGGLFFQSSNHFTNRLSAEQHAAFEALQGLGLLESTVEFNSSSHEYDLGMMTIGSTGSGSYRNATIGSRPSSRQESRHTSRHTSRHGSRSSSRQGSLTHIDQLNQSAFNSNQSHDVIDAREVSAGNFPPAHYDSHTMNSHRSDTSVDANYTVNQNRHIRNGSVGGDTSAFTVLTSRYEPERHDEEKPISFTYSNGPTFQRSLSVGHRDGGLGAPQHYQQSGYSSQSSGYATMPRKPIGTVSYEQQQYHTISSSNQHSYNRSYNSTHNIRSPRDDNYTVNQHAHVRSTSQPALPDIEKEMESLEGLIKDLNGITNSGTIGYSHN